MHLHCSLLIQDRSRGWAGPAVVSALFLSLFVKAEPYFMWLHSLVSELWIQQWLPGHINIHLTTSQLILLCAYMMRASSWWYIPGVSRADYTIDKSHPWYRPADQRHPAVEKTATWRGPLRWWLQLLLQIIPLCQRYYPYCYADTQQHASTRAEIINEC